MDRAGAVADAFPSVGEGLEARLVQASKSGDTAAYGELVRRHQDRVFNVCWRICGNRTEAEDLAQETFVKAFEAIGRFDGRARFYTWLFRIAANLAISAGRRERRAKTVSLDRGPRLVEQDEAPAGERLAAETPTPEEMAMDREAQKLVVSALAELDEEYRVVVTLRDLESLSYEEIAEVLELPVGTVKSRLHRGRLALRERLAPLFG
jgi:RNA polymerase sigma-70 factor (ECF subfamily)